TRPTNRTAAANSGRQRQRQVVVADGSGRWRRQKAAGGGNTPDDRPQLWAQAELCSALIPNLVTRRMIGVAKEHGGLYYLINERNVLDKCYLPIISLVPTLLSLKSSYNTRAYGLLVDAIS
ncbi:hypothetical protein CR513_56836, partial [Mucuna pruriens]